jgi:hypothetical protein
MSRLTLTLGAIVLLAAPARAQQPVNAAADRAAVEAAIRDYVEGFYEGDTVKLMRSVHRDVHKLGFWIPRDSTRYASEMMPFAEFITYANNFRRRGRPTPADAPRVIEIFEVADQTASAKLTAWWGIDYFLLAKYDGRWMIRQVMWQSPPRR